MPATSEGSGQVIQMITSQRQVNDLVRDVEDGRLIPKPPFQRRAVWTPGVKDHFLETVLLGLPFPEIFIVTGKMDPATRSRVDFLVDGQQRVSTLREYLNGSTDLLYKRVHAYADLPADEQKRFLSYPVTVRDLLQVEEQTVADIFARINSTDYALKATERYNALFTGEYRTYCEKLAEDPFFRTHRVFSFTDWKRMGDLTFTLTLVTTVLAGYFRREELLADYLSQYNDEFAERDHIASLFHTAFEFVEACKFTTKCRVWKKTDLFTLLVEACFVIRQGTHKLDPSIAGPRLQAFYDQVAELYKKNPDGEPNRALAVDSSVLRYLKAATKATNDKYARVDRAAVIAPLLAVQAQTDRPHGRGPRSRPKGKGGRELL
jgi:Protein of unknown function DUF262